MRVPRACGFIAILLGGLAACEPSVEGEALSGATVGFEVDPTPITVIGEVDGLPEYELFRVRAAFRLSDGTTVVANAGTSELRFYDEDGRWLRTKGRKGQGPGEFEFIYSANAIRGDTVFVWDHMPRRMTLFPPGDVDPLTISLSLEGELVSLAGRTVPAIAERVGATRSGEIWAASTTPSYVLTGLRATEDGGAEVDPDLVADPGIYHFRTPLFRIDRRGRVAQRTELVLGDAWAVSDEGINYWPLGGYLQVSAGADVFAAGRGVEPEIWVATPEGVRVVSLPFPPATAITDEVWAEVSARGMRSLAEFYEAIPRPDSVPHYSTLLVDDEDRVWLGEYDVRVDIGPERRWDVFDLAGVHQATLHLPSGLTVTDIRDGYLTAVLTDDFGVERVAVYRLTEPAG